MSRKITNGDLKIPITFYKLEPKKGPNPGETKKAILHFCLCEVYASSQKDFEILKTIDSKESLTINIRDPLNDYIPSTKDFAEIDHFRYTGKEWNVVDIRPDAQATGFINILLSFS